MAPTLATARYSPARATPRITPSLPLAIDRLAPGCAKGYGSWLDPEVLAKPGTKATGPLAKKARSPSCLPPKYLGCTCLKCPKVKGPGWPATVGQNLTTFWEGEGGRNSQWRWDAGLVGLQAPVLVVALERAFTLARSGRTL